MTTRWTPAVVDALNRHFAEADARAIAAWAAAELGPRATLASSFGLEDVVVAALLADAAPAPDTFFLDTGRLDDETYEAADAVTRRLGLRLRVLTPDAASLGEFTTKNGFYSFQQSVEARRACCAVRKVEPLARALAGYDAWLTGLRAEQAPTRAATLPFEIDAAHGGILKINPLVRWTLDDVWSFVRARDLPYNKLHDRGYPSIGCAPCTRAVAPGEDARAGRWWWESAETKECGLHRHGALAAEPTVHQPISEETHA